MTRSGAFLKRGRPSSRSLCVRQRNCSFAWAQSVKLPLFESVFVGITSLPCERQKAPACWYRSPFSAAPDRGRAAGSCGPWTNSLAGDEVLTTAILDRLLHRSHVLNIKE